MQTIDQRLTLLRPRVPGEVLVALPRHAATILTMFAIYVAASVCNAAEHQLDRYPKCDSKGVTAYRSEKELVFALSDAAVSPVKIPRIAAPLHAIWWQLEDGNRQGADGVVVHPEPTYWEVRWKERPQGAGRLVLQFDAVPRVLEELAPVEPAGDGSVWLPAHLARTTGEKLRYEPQPFKNTVGYWVVPADAASWNLVVDRDARFNVAILQGCGAGQGGSRAEIVFQADSPRSHPAEGFAGSGAGPRPAADQRLEFEVEETGHFQNFRWRHIGEVQLAKSRYRLVLRPVEIKNKALMDIRAIHLVPQPPTNVKR